MSDACVQNQCESLHRFSSRAGSWTALTLGAAVVSVLAAMAAHADELAKHAAPDIGALSLYAAAYCAAGIAFFAACLLVMGRSRARLPFAAMIVVGIGTRLTFIAAPPILEDDWYRYLLDGALAAKGLNPFAYSPEEIVLEQAPAPYLEVASGAPSGVLERINHPHVKTIYPPLAQAAFAFAHIAAPWSPMGLRLVNMLSDVVCAALLLLVLRASGRRVELWIVYGWNPLVARELINALHMDALVLPFFAWALLCVYRRQNLTAWTAICLAAALKVWPAILLLPIARQMLAQPQRVGVPTKAFGIAFVIAAASWAPIWMGGFEEKSGFVQYARVWENNDLVFRQIRAVVDWILPVAGIAAWKVDIVTRRLVAGVFLVIVAILHLRPASSSDALATRMTAVCLLFFFMSPTQFPWYFTWVLPFLTVRPLYSPLLYVATMALYPLQYPLENTDGYWLFTDVLIPVQHLPVYGLLLFELYRKRRSKPSQCRTMSAP